MFFVETKFLFLLLKSSLDLFNLDLLGYVSDSRNSEITYHTYLVEIKMTNLITK